MPVEVCFTVNAVPVPQPRQRHTKTGHSYTPTKHPVNVFKAAVAAEASKWIEAPIRNPVRVRIMFVLPRPKSLRGKDRVPHTTKRADWDNLAKSVCDAMNQMAYDDDSMIYAASIEKYYASKVERPHCKIWIKEEPPPEVERPHGKTRKRKPDPPK